MTGGLPDSKMNGRFELDWIELYNSATDTVVFNVTLILFPSANRICRVVFGFESSTVGRFIKEVVGCDVDVVALAGSAKSPKRCPLPENACIAGREGTKSSNIL